MIIEVFGLFGVGKSYFLKEIDKKSCENDMYYIEKNNYHGKIVWILHNIKKVFMVILFSVRSWDWRNQLNQILGKNTMTTKQKFKFLINGIYLKIRLDKCNKEKINIIDEGVAQYIWSIIRKINMPNQSIVQIWNLFGHDNKICWLNADRKIIIERLNNRNRKSPIDSIEDGDKILDELLCKQKMILSNLEEANCLKHEDIIVVDTGKQVDYQNIIIQFGAWKNE